MYALQPIETVLKEFSSDTHGLSDAVLPSLREKYGWNELTEKKRSLIALFLRQFKDTLVYILMGALLLSILAPILEGQEITIETFIDSGVILLILLFNAVLGFIQEYKAEEAIAELKKLTAPNVLVRRNGTEGFIPARELLPGDIALLEAGDRISADGRLFAVSHLSVNESSLTGESIPADKNSDTLGISAGIADDKNMVFSGTLVTQGSGEYIVTATGKNTEIGRIATIVSETVIPETPLERRMRHLGFLLGGVVLGLTFIIVLIGLARSIPFFEILLIGVSLAVSAVPEGLPAVVTVCLAMGVRRMVKKNALVRRLESLETLGSITVICADKTGTMTENKMMVIDTWTPDTSDTDLLITAGAACNRAHLPEIGDPTEIALLEYAKRHDIERLPIEEELVPFTSEEKYMKTKHGALVFVKGAPEKVVQLCDGCDAGAILAKNESMANEGIRVLACAVEENGKPLRFIGLIGMEDPPRQGVKEAIQMAKTAGIRTIMITGDNVVTAAAIARQIGIEGDRMTGVEIDALEPDALRQKVKTVVVFARVSPAHKISILQALQQNGEVVSMSGDGVNDAPALKGAHVGVAMGLRGTQVAREAASIILADDHFQTIVSAIAEGRRIYDNIRKFVLFLLRANFDELLFILSAILLGFPLPYLPLHILWINLLTDGLPALALGMEEAEPDIMKRPPRPRGEHILAGQISALAIAILWGFTSSLGLYLWNLSSGMSIDEARTVAVTYAIMFELFLVFSTRSQKPIHTIGFFGNKWLLAAVAVPLVLQFVIIYTPINVAFGVVPLGMIDWAMILPLSLSGFIVFESLKYTKYGVRVSAVQRV